MQDLKISLIQSELHWQSPSANLAMFEEKIWQIQGQTDLIVLPEMFTTGFTMDASVHAEPMNLHATKWLKQMAAQTKAVVTGSVIIRDGENFYNRLIWAEPDGNISFYDKRHLFRMAGEDQHYAAGSSRLIKSIKGWKIMPLICYDLRFPVWSRNRNREYDLLLYVANWPAVRSIAWKTLLRARAIENVAYVAGLNRVGTDGKGLEYSGDSAIIDFKGTTLEEVSDKEAFITATLSSRDLLEFREKFPAWMDADDFDLKI